jgi:hypothetical protein
LVAERNTLVAALRQMCREDWEAIWRETIEGVIEHADYSVAGYCNRWDGSFYLPCDEVFWSYSNAAPSVVLDSADSEAVIAGARITITVNVVDIPVTRIYSRMINPAKEGVDGAELGSWLRAIGVGHDDPTDHPVQDPRGPAIRRAVEHVVDVLRSSASRSDISLK